jgi:hypothetical protein
MLGHDLAGGQVVEHLAAGKIANDSPNYTTRVGTPSRAVVYQRRIRKRERVRTKRPVGLVYQLKSEIALFLCHSTRDPIQVLRQDLSNTLGIVWL